MKNKVGKKILSYMDDNEDWDSFGYELTHVLKKKNPNGYWQARVQNFGWRSLSGSKVLKADTGTEFLQNLLPQTDCHFNIFHFGKGIAVQNYHHDSPTGNEWYYILPITEEQYYKIKDEQ